MAARIDIARARAAKAKLVKRLGELRITAGVGLTQVGEDFALKVNLTAPSSTSVPEEIDGVRVVSSVVGPIRKQRA